MQAFVPLQFSTSACCADYLRIASVHKVATKCGIALCGLVYILDGHWMDMQRTCARAARDEMKLLKFKLVPSCHFSQDWISHQSNLMDV